MKDETICILKKDEAKAKYDDSLLALNDVKSKYKESRNMHKHITNRTPTTYRRLRDTEVHNTSNIDAIENISAQIGVKNGKTRIILKLK